MEKAMEYYQIGVNLGRNGNYPEALIYLKKAIEIKPDFGDAYYDCGVTYLESEMYKDALDCFLKSVKYNTKYMDSAYFNIGLIYSALKNFPNAIYYYNEAIKINDSDYQTYYNRGNVFAIMKEYDKAINDYTKSISLNEFSQTYFNRGNIFALTGKYNEAINDFTKAIEINPFFIEAYQRRYCMYDLLNEKDNMYKDAVAIKIIKNKTK